MGGLAAGAAASSIGSAILGRHHKHGGHGGLGGLGGLGSLGGLGGHGGHGGHKSSPIPIGGLGIDSIFCLNGLIDK